MKITKRGDTGADVETVQDLLSRLGFPIHPSEYKATFGPSTQAAVRAFQQSRGLDVDGLVGDATRAQLHESFWSLGDRLIKLERPNMRGDDVRDLQSHLNGLGFDAGKHDGIFGPQTVEAVREFQRNLAISEDGMVGNDTIGALSRLRMVLRSEIGPRVRERRARESKPAGLAGKRVALDPGHGGQDPGHSSSSGETEAEICFRIAAVLAKLIERESAAVVLTRGPHDGPEPSTRAAIANDFAADLCISIHLNSHAEPTAQGAATYFFESGGVASEPGEMLAQAVGEQLVLAGRQDCRTHGRSYQILKETRMPALVVEPCFLSNPEEAKLLSDPDGLSGISAALLEGLKAYFSAGAV